MQPEGLDGLAKAVASEVAAILRPEIARLVPSVQPALLTVKDAAVYLGRSEQAIQHLIFEKQLPVVRFGRRVHLDRKDLDAFIEKNKY
jgi:excisionase family DNA binding protein